MNQPTTRRAPILSLPAMTGGNTLYNNLGGIQEGKQETVEVELIHIRYGTLCPIFWWNEGREKNAEKCILFFTRFSFLSV